LLSGIIWNARKESNVHENAKLIGKGGSRLVFRISNGNKPGNFTYDVALKVSRFDREFDPISYENQRVDAVVSERLTAAPDVMDVYGFCALSALNELSSGFDVRQIVKRLSLWDPLEIVEMVFQATTALVRVHSIDYTDALNATLVHNDITHNNYVVSNRGTLKLSDFNLSVLLRWNITSDRSCGFLQRRFGGAGGIHVVSLSLYVVRAYPSKVPRTATHWLSLCITFFHKNSPPESLYDNTTLLAEKIDVYGIGTLIFQFLTSHELYHQELIDLNISRNDEQKVLKLITAGVEPQLPEAVEGSNDTAILGLKKIMREALNYNVTNRPSALELKKKLQGIFHSPQEHREVQKSLSLKLLLLSKNK
jgi:serine/threonine protein kinase